LHMAYEADVELESWIRSYTVRRYRLNDEDENIGSAWTSLLAGPYQSYYWGGVTKNLMVKRPTLDGVSTGFMATNISYDPQTMKDAWAFLVMDDIFDTASKAYQYDVVDFGRQVISNAFLTDYEVLMAAVKLKDIDLVTSISNRMLSQMDDLDTHLSCDENWLLGPWLERAKAWGESPEWLEFNARNQITLWGPTGNINDYASKQWSGLIRTYYKPRWELFFKMLQLNLQIDMKAFNTRVYEQVELPWQYDRSEFQTKASHEVRDTACKLLPKYTDGHRDCHRRNLRYAERSGRPVYVK